MTRQQHKPTLMISCIFFFFFLQILTGSAFVQTSSSRSPSIVVPTTTTRSLHRQQQQQQPNTFRVTNLSFATIPPSTTTSSLSMAASENGGKEKSSSLPFWLDPGTRGGAVVLSLILFLLPLIAYSVVTNVLGVDEVEAGKWIGVGFTATASFLWVATYIFRVATKDMTYAKQLKDYENAVIAKRLEELDDDEIQALVEEIERDDF